MLTAHLHIGFCVLDVVGQLVCFGSAGAVGIPAYLLTRGTLGKMCIRDRGIPSFDDKLIQEVVRLILESIYEPTFSDYSHGFRINRSCHTAVSYTHLAAVLRYEGTGCPDCQLRKGSEEP